MYFDSLLESLPGVAPGGSRGGSVVKNPHANAGDMGLIPGLEGFLGEGNGNSVPYSCLENPHGREAWGATVHRVAKRQTWLSDWTTTTTPGTLPLTNTLSNDGFRITKYCVLNHFFFMQSWLSQSWLSWLLPMLMVSNWVRFALFQVLKWYS